MSLVKVILFSLLVLVSLLTSFQLIRRDEWWIRVSDFPHVHLTITTAVLLISVLLFFSLQFWYEWLIIGLGVSTFIYQLIIIYPYTPFSPTQSKNWSNVGPGDTISILEANVFMENRDYDRLIELINTYDPDVVIGLETDEEWEKALKVIESKYVYSIKDPRDNTYGALFYSKYEILKSNINYVIKDDIPSFEADLMLMSGKEIRIYVVHPEPPSPTENDRSTERDAELVLIGRKASKCHLPVIVAGDLNDVAWSHTTRLFQRISGLLDPRIGRGFFNTFHAKYPLFRWPLDHVFHSKEFLVKNIKRLDYIGSDHFPMFIELSLEPAKGVRKNGDVEESDEEDIKEAKEKLNKLRD